ncbi:hypothetical protein LEP1GSC158_3859 [Leptospira interrogans serovar Zanoni str. LT2156]|uniref:Uncharacterized protein n=1 Tax=Leptospira interrogans serovar Zanoni str. LT2156 TaxID=1001601 RepID=M6HRL9_LEPIR|nr:hypothetical protein LEP1GSC158_3859 [Leptospira interrogans serovar Zanoni str. LT2156]
MLDVFLSFSRRIFLSPANRFLIPWRKKIQSRLKSAKGQ